MAIDLTNARALTAGIVGITREDVAAKLSRIADLAAVEWERLAREALSRQTADTYSRAIQVLERNPDRVVIALIGTFPNMLEQGAPSWDLRETILLSPKAKWSKGGHKYMSIPFRHATPGTRGDAGTPMGQGFDDAKEQGKRIYGAAKALRATVSGLDAAVEVAKLRATNSTQAERELARMTRSKTHTLWGGIKTEGDNRAARLPAGLAPRLKAHHAGDIYAGMYHFEASHQEGPDGSYGTFRTISTNPDTHRGGRGEKVYIGRKGAGGHVYYDKLPTIQGAPRQTANWIHPGFSALNLVDKVVTYLDTDVFPHEFGDEGDAP